VIFDTTVTDAERAELLWNHYQSLQTELREHKKNLLDKSSLVSINKIDLYSSALQKEILSLFKKNGVTVHLFSGVTGLGLPDLTEALFRNQ